MDVILESVDRVRKLMEAAQEGNEGPAVEDILAALGEAVEGGATRKLGEILVEDEGVPQAMVEQALAEGGGKLLGQVLVEKAAVSSEAVERSLDKQTRQRAPQAEQTIRVDVSRLDSLMNLVGELVLGKNRLARLRSQMVEHWEGEPLVEQLGETSAQIDLVASDLQLAVMKTRLVPIGKVFRKFPRMVRDLARTMRKEIRLETEGESTELDKSVVEVIGDPLVHLIRNSADHGVEAPDERVAAGKPREGQIHLSARHEGNHIVVSIRDDGKGMDPEALKRKAVEKGVISPQEAASMGKREALNLIFAPGFSMAKQVTNVSGRGVGMDVVKTNIQQLNGLIEIESELGVGTRVDVRIPLTLAIIQALLVRSHDETYAVPLVSVVETVRIDPGEVKTVDQFPVLRLRDQVLPLLRVDEMFSGGRRRRSETPTSGDASGNREYVVVIGVAEKRVGLVVQGLVGEEEVVIKNLGGYLSDTPGIAGATIRGDGRVTLIVDVSQILELAAQHRAAAARAVA
jgi:two-component system chemotaxis sensor kinase CheA